MPERFFVGAVRDYGRRRGIDIDVRADGWLIAMRRGAQQHHALGYDIGLNSAIAHRLATDKSATADVLAHAGVRCIPHHLFIDPRIVPRPGLREAMRELLAQAPHGLVLKPNDGTAGRLVIRATTERELDDAVARIFTASQALAISPFRDIAQEVRVILLGEAPMAAYRKERLRVTGDGVRTLRQLARAVAPDARLDEIAPEPDAVVPAGETRLACWRHNLDAGATPVLLADGEDHAACVALARDAARAIGITFASIDIVCVDGAWAVLEINSGVMMESFGRRYPDIARATYDAALDRVFGIDP